MTFSACRCRVTIEFPFLAVVTLALTIDRSGAAAVGLLCAALHEAAHFAAMWAFGGAPRELCFTAFGIDMMQPRENRSYGRDVFISLAGPLANLAAAALCFLLFGRQYELFLDVNLLLFAFNLLPVAPLDGGRVLRSALCTRMEPERAERVVCVVSFCVLVPLAAAGFFILLRSRWNFTLLFAACYLMALLLLKKDC